MTSPQPLPIPLDINSFTDVQLDALILKKRERRLKLAYEYEQASLIAQQADEEKLKLKLEKALGVFKKKLDNVDKLLDDLEGRITSLHAIRLEIGDISWITPNTKPSLTPLKAE